MATLHTVNKSPFEKNSLDQCLARAVDGAGLILIEDGVLAAVSNSSVSERLAGESSRIKLFVLEPDLAVRGFADANLVDGITRVDYEGFVELVTQHERVHSWL